MYHIKCNRAILILTCKDINFLCDIEWKYKSSFAWEIASSIETQKNNQIITVEVHDSMLKEIVEILSDGNNN